MINRRQLQYVFSLFLLILAFLILNLIFSMGGGGRQGLCIKTLEATGKAIDSYQKDFNGVPPPSLAALKPYLRGWYRQDQNGVPICIGNRRETEDTTVSWPYVYRPISGANYISPICWDSKSHRIDRFLIPNSYTRNVLFSDGHIEILSERKFFALMHNME